MRWNRSMAGFADSLRTVIEDLLKVRAVVKDEVHTEHIIS